MSEETYNGVYLVYCKYRYGKRSGEVATLGPVVSTREEAEKHVETYIRFGWDATWVGLNDQAVWIVT